MLENNNVALPICEIEKNEAKAKNGWYVLKASGNPISQSPASYGYKFAEVKIPVVADLQLSFWKKTTNDLGKYVSVDLIFKSGKRLSKLANYKNNFGSGMAPSVGIGTVGNGWENVSCQIGIGELIGDEISGICIFYAKPSSSGSYLAYFDDILISIKKDNSTALAVIKNNQTFQFVTSRNQTLIFNTVHLNSLVKVYDLSGKLLSEFVLNSTEVQTDLRNGIYLIHVINKQGIYNQKIIL